MAAKGIRCTDCHDPHTGRLKANGNALCTQCHKPENFDNTAHYFHPVGTAGAQCVNCHMPTRTYMVVHSRRDHRLAIPRPDLSDTLGTPNPCIGCHQDKTNSWAAEAVRTRTPSIQDAWGTTAWMATHEQTGIAARLRNLLSGASAGSTNPIVKAAVLASVKSLTPEALDIVRSQLSAGEPLVRLGAVQATVALPLEQRAPLLISLLRDPILAVRLQAVSQLIGIDKARISADQRAAFESAIAEYRKWLAEDADRADALVALAGLQAEEGDIASAQATFEKALQRDETSLSVLLNYADFHRARGDDAAAEPLLNRALALYPDSASAHLAMGLLRVRQKRAVDAVPELARAAALSPDESNFAYVFGVSLYSTGRIAEGLTVLDKARRRFPANAQIQSAMQAYCDEQRLTSICTAYAAGK